MILEIFVRTRALCGNLFPKEYFLLIHARLLTNVEFTCPIRSQVGPLTLAEHRIFHGVKIKGLQGGIKVMED